jgi:hypothetical protein
MEATLHPHVGAAGHAAERQQPTARGRRNRRKHKGVFRPYESGESYWLTDSEHHIINNKEYAAIIRDMTHLLRRTELNGDHAAAYYYTKQMEDLRDEHSCARRNSLAWYGAYVVMEYRTK